jgi:hypothetical protein
MTVVLKQSETECVYTEQPEISELAEGNQVALSLELTLVNTRIIAAVIKVLTTNT